MSPQVNGCATLFKFTFIFVITSYDLVPGVNLFLLCAFLLCKTARNIYFLIT